MKRTKLLLSGMIFTMLLTSCGKEKQLEEVEVPSPESRQETSTEMGNPEDVAADPGTFQMMKLPYKYDALEPHIDAKTVEVHYSKHHVGYVNNLNKAIAGTELEKQTIEDILGKLDLENKAVRNNAGGYWNHNLYWEVMAANKGGQPSGALAEAINKDFGSFDAFKTQISEAASKQFGSGWAWLVVDKTGKLAVGSTANQDNPLMPGQSISGTPILGLDVWEHAYYLKYQNKRPDYIEAFFKLVNWDVVAKKYEAAKTPAPKV
ncbi:superoxide dismutase [Flavobacterium sp. NST-5]|uniref:superoxide dismutase n=1 Tax=Flavobacterium ichthyis TaxID=2698827 RepID=A0ABW9ZDY6_9FLAO|nr:superoxide dismutase [Flavobacterium ichthyis]NBL65310.1 superoxide dismutase [Flavobacterium ichthyis]